MDSSSFKQIDLPEALSRVGGDRELLTELAVLFIEESNTLLLNLRTAVNERDPRGIETHAHGLKGSVINFGAKELYGYLRDLEQKGRERDMTGVDELFESLDQSAARFTQELRLLAAGGG